MDELKEHIKRNSVKDEVHSSRVLDVPDIPTT